MTDNIIFTNNASALLAASIGTGDTTVQVATGFGANFPSPSGDQFFYATLEDNSGNIEIVRCTSRSGDNLTVVRAQDGSTAQSFTLTVTRVELRLTKVVMEEFLQKNGGTMTGDIDMNGNEITDAVLDGSSTQILGGEIVNVPLRGLTTATGNQILVPTDGTTRATAGGATILAAGDDVVAELDTAGVIILDSATVGVRIPATAYLRIEGTSSGDYLEMAHDDTDFNFTFVDADDLNITGLTNGVVLQDLDLRGPQLIDFALRNQTVAAAGTTNIDYEGGSYVTVTMGMNITTLNLQNPPSSHTGVFRLKFEQDGTGGRTCSFTGIHFPAGSAPVLSAGANEVDFIDIWTDDGGTKWYGAYNNDWQAV